MSETKVKMEDKEEISYYIYRVGGHRSRWRAESAAKISSARASPAEEEETRIVVDVEGWTYLQGGHNDGDGVEWRKWRRIPVGVRERWRRRRRRWRHRLRLELSGCCAGMVRSPRWTGTFETSGGIEMTCRGMGEVR